MESVNKLLEQWASVFLFCLGLSLLLLNYNNLSRNISLLKDSLSQENILREQGIEEVVDNGQLFTVSGGGLLGYLTGTPETDITIDGITYSKDAFKSRDFDYSLLQEGMYRKEYKLDKEGDITEIAFWYLKEEQ